MINPCTDCLVDVMCIDPCDKFIFYMDDVKSYHTSKASLFHVVNTDARYKRSRKCAFTYQTTPIFGVDLLSSRRELLSQRKEEIRNEKRVAYSK